MVSDTNINTDHCYRVDLDQTKRPSENLYHLLYKDPGLYNWKLKNKSSLCSFTSSVPSLNSVEENQSILSKESTASKSTTTTAATTTTKQLLLLLPSHPLLISIATTNI